MLIYYRHGKFHDCLNEKTRAVDPGYRMLCLKDYFAGASK